MSLYRIIMPPDGHRVWDWIGDRNVKSGSFPLPIPIADKLGGKKGRPIIYDNKKMDELRRRNTDNGFDVARRIGGFLFNSAANKHLISFLGKTFGKLIWWKNNFVPYPLPKGKKAKAEKIRMVGDVVEVDRIRGKWAHIKSGVSQLCQVDIATKRAYKSSVFWSVPAGWIELELLFKIN